MKQLVTMFLLMLISFIISSETLAQKPQKKDTLIVKTSTECNYV